MSARSMNQLSSRLFSVLAVLTVGSATLLNSRWDSAVHAADKAAGSARLQRVEAKALELPGAAGNSPTTLSMAELMKAYNVPGLSIAVIENFKIVDAKAYGVIAAGSQTQVTTRTTFQAASISKPVTATAALHLVEQGKLSLDEDVNVKLKTWKVPENEFTKTQKVTLRRLMSHNAGLTVHGFPGYDVDVPVPTVVQVLNGESPANTDPIRVDVIPGSTIRYSGGGITIEQLLMMDVSGKAFPALMRETVIDKIGMSDSSYDQPLPPARAAMSASGTSGDGKPVHGKWHVYPEMAAAGLWTTPTDLAKFAIEIALSHQGKSNKILSQKMTQEMLTPIKDGAGLGFFMEEDNPGTFGHNGANEGFQSLLTMNYETGSGVAIMANSDNGITVMQPLFERVVKEYAWRNYKLRPNPAGDLYYLASLKGAQAAIQRYDELKKAQTEKAALDEAAVNNIGYRLLFSGKEADAVQIFQKNVQEYPQSSNAYDSLGEAYAKTGQKDLAIQNYEKAVQLDPKAKSSIESLNKLKGEAMSPKVIEHDGFTVIGIAARTTNAKEMTPDGIIGKQWGRLFQEGVLEKIPNKADHNVVAVYTDYASDHNGEYTFVLGARVTSDANVPEGMVAKKIPSGKFAVFTSEKGVPQKVVPELWMKIASLPVTATGGDRTYRADYEIYDERAMDPQNLQMDVYVGIK